MRRFRNLAKTFVAFSVILTACEPVKVPEPLSTRLRGVQSELSITRANIMNTTAAVASLRDSSGTDVKPQITAFTNNLTALESKAGGLQVIGVITQDKANIFFQRWGQEIDRIQNQDLAQAAQDQRKDVIATFDSLNVRIESLREAYRPYYQALCDVRTALTADPTPQGVAKIRPSLDKAISLQPRVLSKLDDVNKKIDTMVGP